MYCYILNLKYGLSRKYFGIRKNFRRKYSSNATSPKNLSNKLLTLSELLNKSRMQGYINTLWKYLPAPPSLKTVISHFPFHQQRSIPKKNALIPSHLKLPVLKKEIQVNQPPIDMGKALTEWFAAGDGIETLPRPPSPANEKKVVKASSAKTPKASSTSFRDWIDWSKSGKDQSEKTKDQSKRSLLRSSVKLQGSIEGRTIFLLKSLATASSTTSKLQRLEELCRHLMVYPEEKNLLIKRGALHLVLSLQESERNEAFLEVSRQALALLGYTKPPEGKGIRILSIDGGGTRGILGIEILRQLEARTGKRVYELFDYACGVSTGAIMLMVLFAARQSLDECEEIYLKFSKDIFCRNTLVGTGNLIWSQSYYDTAQYAKHLRAFFGELNLIDTAKYKPSPKIAAVSSIVNQPLLKVFVFRNYALPFRANSVYPGSCQYKVWEAVRASGAAPGYFQSFTLDEYVHQDGGMAMNNPTALAIHEAKLLWPHENIQCVVSLGSGRFKYIKDYVSPGLKTTLFKVLDSATDTEAFHTVLRDHLPSHTYFRFNPYMTEQIYLDEYREEKLKGLKQDAQKYLQWNEHKVNQAVEVLLKSRTRLQTLKDYANRKALIWRKSK